jgi:hypothetical protein
MSIRPSPLLGYNNNIRHKGKVFHIQTEDSGVKYGHISTHLFTDGGRILRSVKASYGEYIGNERMAEIVREMMKQQHKSMFIALREGKFDSAADGKATEIAPASRAPAVDAVSKPPPQGPGEATRPTTSGPPPLPRTSRVDRLSSSSMAAAAPRAEPPSIREPEELTLDIDALERAAAADLTPSELQVSSDLPSPPADLFRERTVAAAVASSSGPALPRPPAISSPVGERRYAPTRPASIFGQARPQQGKSIFGEDLMSDKSLDEVILSYLADDLDGEDK